MIKKYHSITHATTRRLKKIAHVATMSTIEQEATEGKGFKILAPRKLLTRIPIY